ARLCLAGRAPRPVAYLDACPPSAWPLDAARPPTRHASGPARLRRVPQREADLPDRLGFPWHGGGQIPATQAFQQALGQVLQAPQPLPRRPPLLPGQAPEQAPLL